MERYDPPLIRATFPGSRWYRITNINRWRHHPTLHRTQRFRTDQKLDLGLFSFEISFHLLKRIRADWPLTMQVQQNQIKAM